MAYTEQQIIDMGMTPKATYGGNVVSFIHPSTGDYVWDIKVLDDILPLIQRRANKLVKERNKKLQQLFNSQSSK